LKTSDSKLAGYQLEIEKKDKLVQMYMLKQYEDKLQPVVKERKFSVNLLSSKETMQKMDPVLLAGVNLQMQKLLEVLFFK
jgi:hypothetical protein